MERAERIDRRRRVAEAIGSDAIALVPGAPWLRGSTAFRQSNEFHYLVDVDTPQAYLTIDGGSGESILYLPHHDPKRERSEGALDWSETGEAIAERTGVSQVLPVEDLARMLARRFLRPGTEVVYLPFAPYEGAASSRDGLLASQAEWAGDPWDGSPSREARVRRLLQERFPQIEVRDLSPFLDSMRLHKSGLELVHLRRAGLLSALGVVAAMRCTRPGVTEYQLAAMADLVYRLNGAQGVGYSAIVAGGTNAWMGHYWRLDDRLEETELVLMDYAPDVAHYTSDIGRVWPVNGTFTAQDRTTYEFVLRYHRTLLAAIGPGRTADEIQDEVAATMEKVLEDTDFGTEGRRRAALGMLEFRGHLSHPVGMSVHDVGDYRSAPLQPGLVLSIDPMMWIEDERLYVRVEDTVAITESGLENLTARAPIDVADIEAEVGADHGRTLATYVADE